ncbi:hypothetical protein SAMN05421830_106200 [Desulfomicrobium norvegicum]|uniref:Uncharacterized protein n=1 Tax=Desulfomicrobium norvegicum (strain DSM 1741 / NCIMB 8310) TaxID=52561 RepID=A0A8G2F7R1_DESNO|nr:hypothetical protein SAMN05421830_106200 [Desulfomicrobium norvegicum]
MPRRQPGLHASHHMPLRTWCHACLDPVCGNWHEYRFRSQAWGRRKNPKMKSGRFLAEPPGSVNSRKRPLSSGQFESASTSSRWNFQGSTSTKKPQTCFPSPLLLNDSPYNKHIFEIPCAWIDALANFDGDAPGFSTTIIDGSLLCPESVTHRNRRLPPAFFSAIP